MQTQKPTKTEQILSRIHDEIVKLTDMRLQGYDAVESYREIRGLQKALQVIHEVEKEENENLEYAHMNFCEVQARAKESKENVLLIEVDNPKQDIHKIIMNGQEVSAKNISKIVLECLPGEYPKLNVEYIFWKDRKRWQTLDGGEVEEKGDSVLGARKGFNWI